MGISGIGTRGAAWRVDAAKVRAIMSKQGLTNKRLSEMMHKTYHSVLCTMKYSQCGHLFKLSTVQELADALGVQVNDIAAYEPQEGTWTDSDS